MTKYHFFNSLKKIYISFYLFLFLYLFVALASLTFTSMVHQLSILQITLSWVWRGHNGRLPLCEYDKFKIVNFQNHIKLKNSNIHYPIIYIIVLVFDSKENIYNKIQIISSINIGY